MKASRENRPTVSGAASDEPRRAAFRDLHGPRLHGFALLLTLGDQPLAARLAAQALAASATRTSELSHPERAAAWLRQHVVRGAGGRLGVADARPDRRRPALEELGVDGVALAGLSALGVRERAALVATTVERLDRRDVAQIVGMDGTRLERLVRRARRRALRAGGVAFDDRADADGPLATRIRAIAARTMA